jgi:hypothetical protein
MSDNDRLLELIEEGVVAHGGQLGGWTRRGDEGLQLFDGRVTLRAELHEDETPSDGLVHMHVITTLHEHDDEVLDACLMGVGRDREQALQEASVIWITCVAGPIKSFVDGRPVCMTCQAGVQGGDASAGYVEGDYGLAGLRAYVGPSIARGFDDERIHSAIDETKPWFRFAAESAAPRRIHIAKATVVSNGKAGWRRELEVDGHEVSHHDPHWPAGVDGPEFGYMTRFAVFELPRNSSEMARRAELERTMRHFAEHFLRYESIDSLMAEMVQQGFDTDMVHEVESISTIAFGRALFEQLGVKYASTVIRARRDGSVEMDVPLMSIPAFSRARVLAEQLRSTLPAETFQALCLYSAESNAIQQAIEAHGDELDLSGTTMYPCVVPDRGVSQQTMDEAFAALNGLVERGSSKAKLPSTARKEPWWRFWR